MVHVSTMADDYYRFVEKAHILRGEKNGRVYRLGDRVRVQVIRVDLERRQIDLGLSEILDSVRRSERPGASRRGGPKPKQEERSAKRGRQKAAKPGRKR
jgi:ribonuclease R